VVAPVVVFVTLDVELETRRCDSGLSDVGSSAVEIRR
jgi:hypothetical protein